MTSKVSPTGQLEIPAALRRETMTKLGWSLRDLYRSPDEPGANPLRDAHAVFITTNCIAAPQP